MDDYVFLPGNFDKLTTDEQLLILDYLSPASLIKFCSGYTTNKQTQKWCRLLQEQIFPQRIHALDPDYQIRDGEDLLVVYKTLLYTYPRLYLDIDDELEFDVYAVEPADYDNAEAIDLHPVYLSQDVRMGANLWVAINADEEGHYDADHPFVSMEAALDYLMHYVTAEITMYLDDYIFSNIDRYLNFFTPEEVAQINDRVGDDIIVERVIEMTRHFQDGEYDLLLQQIAYDVGHIDFDPARHNGDEPIFDAQFLRRKLRDGNRIRLFEAWATGDNEGTWLAVRRAFYPERTTSIAEIRARMQEY